ncbi:MAG: hypothetical protein WD468_09585 [Pirellulales bacterium]
MITQARYSPKVALALKVHGRELALSHVGPSDVTVREACEFVPPSEAVLLITVDDETESYKIFLPHGIPNAPQRVAYI